MKTAQLLIALLIPTQASFAADLLGRDPTSAAPKLSGSPARQPALTTDNSRDAVASTASRVDLLHL